MKKVMDPIIKVLSWFMAAFIFASVVVIALQIFWRYVLRSPLSWTEQVGRYLFVWMVSLAVPIATYKGTMFAFDLVLNKMPYKLRSVVQCVILLLCEVFTCYYFYQAVSLCVMGGWRRAQGINIPMLYLYIAQPICAGVLFLVFLHQGIETIKNYRSAAGKE